jgi:uncharacterized protein YjbI with pentapeptide repeats
MLMEEHGDSEGGPPNALVVPSHKIRTIITSNSDIGHRIFAGAILDGLVARQSIFPGAVFRNCEIINCDFSRSDFEGVRFEKCKLDGSSFENCDIRSSLLADCEVRNCKFEGAYFSDNIIRNGILENIVFDHATMIGNEFVYVCITNMTNERSTILHNDFICSELSDVKLGNCTALYSYFQACQFSRFSINADALGLSFGLKSADLENAGLIFLGRDEGKPVTAGLADELIKEFQSRGWALHSIIAKLNFGRIEPLSGWLALFEFLKNSITDGRARLDDISFVLHVADRVAQEQQLPFYAVVWAHDSIADVVLAERDPSNEARALPRLRSGLIALIGSMQERFLEGAASFWDIPIDTPATVELLFTERPGGHPGAYIEYLVQQVTGAPVPLRQLGGHPGSWHEVMQTTVVTALALYTTLFLIEGSLIRLLLIRARLDQLVAPKLPKKFIDQANEPHQILPRNLLQILRSLFSALTKASLQIPGRELGLTAKNLKEITVKTLGD